MPPLPHARYHLCICCGSSFLNLSHKVLVLVCLAPPCSGGPPGAVNTLTLSNSYIILSQTTIPRAIITHLPMSLLRCWDCPVQHVTHCALSGTILQWLVHKPSMPLLVCLMDPRLSLLLVRVNMIRYSLRLLLHVTQQNCWLPLSPRLCDGCLLVLCCRGLTGYWSVWGEHPQVLPVPPGQPSGSINHDLVLVEPLALDNCPPLVPYRRGWFPL